MDALKPVVEFDAVASLMERRLGEPVRGLTKVAGGNVAQTFSFAAGGREYIVRFNVELAANFEKERFISGQYGSAAIPIPRIVDIGRFGRLRYAVSERATGVPLTDLPPAELAALFPTLLDTLDAIHAADVSGTTGYGVIGDDGNGLSSSWRSYLAAANEDGPEGDYFAGWHTLFETSFLDRAAFDRLYARMEELLPYCPDERYLVHGDFGFGNLLAREGKVTAVIDWLHAIYGDFLYDIAWLDFWSAGANIAETCRRRYASQGRAVPNFDGRLRCYHAYMGLMAARFFAKAGDEPAYRWLQDRLRELGFDDA